MTAGYVVVSPTSRPAGFGAGVPDPFVTISWCLAEGLRVPEFSGWFQNLEQAREARVGEPADAMLLVVSMTPGDADELIDEMADEPEHFRLLRSGTPEPADAHWLGFEIVGAESNLSLHSWHCHDYAAVAEAELSVRLNALGLLANYDEAATVRRWMLDMPRDQLPAPVPWAVVRLGSLAS